VNFDDFRLYAAKPSPPDAVPADARPKDDIKPSVPDAALASKPAEGFENALVSHTWSWWASDAANNASLAFTFSADGNVTSSSGLKLRWKFTGPRMLAIASPDGRAALLNFDGAFRTFDTLGFDGKTKVTGFQKTLVATQLPLPVIPAIPPSNPAGPSQAARKAEGISIAGINQDQSSVLLSTGGHSHEIQDLRALLSGFGAPNADTAPHPDAEIYPGIHYLMPWHEAEKVLVPISAPTRSGGKIACAGFPDGLNWICYDGKWDWSGGTYNHLYILKDILSQVVCIEFRQEHGYWVQQAPPWQNIGGNWHVIDYINAEVKGLSDINIDTQVLDERNGKHRIVVHTSNQKINHTATMFLPQPLIDLILFCVSRSDK
jgi:hypothetical protein